MKEASFSAIFRKQAREYFDTLSRPVHQYLIQDSYRSGKKPYDAYMVIDKRFYSIEFKAEKTASLRLDRFSDHQVEYAKEVTKAGGISLFIVLFETQKESFLGLMRYRDYLRAVAEFGKDKATKVDALLELGFLKRIDKVNKSSSSRAKIWDFAKIWSTDARAVEKRA